MINGMSVLLKVILKMKNKMKKQVKDLLLQYYNDGFTIEELIDEIMALKENKEYLIFNHVYIFYFLKKLHDNIPTTENRKHNLTVEDDNLVLSIAVEGGWRQMKFNKDDYDLENIEEMIDFIKGEL